jgi:hypothetical protein
MQNLKNTRYDRFGFVRNAFVIAVVANSRLFVCECGTRRCQWLFGIDERFFVPDDVYETNGFGVEYLGFVGFFLLLLQGEKF